MIFRFFRPVRAPATSLIRMIRATDSNRVLPVTRRLLHHQSLQGISSREQDSNLHTLRSRRRRSYHFPTPREIKKAPQGLNWGAKSFVKAENRLLFADTHDQPNPWASGLKPKLCMCCCNHNANLLIKFVVTKFYINFLRQNVGTVGIEPTQPMATVLQTADLTTFTITPICGKQWTRTTIVTDPTLQQGAISPCRLYFPGAEDGGIEPPSLFTCLRFSRPRHYQLWQSSICRHNRIRTCKDSGFKPVNCSVRISHMPMYPIRDSNP